MERRNKFESNRSPETEASLENRFIAALSSVSKETKGAHLSALLDMANKWQAQERREVDEVAPRKIGRDFKETFSGEGRDGIDGRIDTISLDEGDRAFMITDLHGDEESANQAFRHVIKETVDGENKVHLVNLGDFATYENDESIDPMKSFLILEALKKIDPDKLEELLKEGGSDKEATLEKYLAKSLVDSGIPQEELANIIRKIKDNLEIHALAGNGELYIPPIKQVGEQLGRTVNVLGSKRAEKFFNNLPLSVMIRGQKKDIFASHFLPPMVKKENWERDGLASINDESISDLRIEAGIWGGFDKDITPATIEKKAKEAGVSPDELWALGRLTVGNVGGVRELKEKRITFSGLPTFQRILSTKERPEGAYIFGHESSLAGSEEKGYYNETSEDGSDEVICFHSGGGEKVAKKIMLEIDSAGEIKPITLRES